MAYSQVRILAREFANGLLSREDYREQRAALIEQMVAGKLAIDYQERVAQRPSSIPAPVPLLVDVGDDEAEVRRSPIILGAIAIVLGICAAGYWTLRLQTAGPAPVIAEAPVSPAAHLLREFVARGEYGVLATSAFEEALYALPAADQAAAREDPAWRRLAFALRSEIRQLRSLAAVDESGEMAAEVQRLEEFSGRLGIQLP